MTHSARQSPNGLSPQLSVSAFVSSLAESETTFDDVLREAQLADIEAIDPAQDRTANITYTCERCQTSVKRDRPARFCPHCGLPLLALLADGRTLDLVEDPMPADPMESLDPTEIEQLMCRLAGVEAATDAPAADAPPVDQPATPSPLAPASADTPAIPARPLTRDDVLLILQAWQRILEAHPQAVNNADWQNLPGQQPRPEASPRLPQASLIVAGYANALCRLGAFYESSLSSHNSDEAVRCYLKAARLGNLEALSRLAPKCVQ